MASSRKRAPQCGHCGRTGHNMRTCSERPARSSTLKKSSLVSASTRASHNINTAAKKDTKQQLFVRAHTPADPSPFIVDLAKPKQKVDYTIPVYEEKKVNKGERPERLDFAALIEKANKHAPKMPSIPVQGEPKAKPIVYPSQIGDTEFSKAQKESRTPAQEKKEQYYGKEKKQFFRIGALLAVRSRAVTFPLKKISNVGRSFRNIFRRDAKSYSVPLHEKIAQLFKSIQWKFLAVRAIAVLLVIALPFPAVGYYKKVQDTGNEVVGASTHAFHSLQSSTFAAFDANLEQAQHQLSEALSAFSHANDLLDNHHKGLQAIIRVLPIVGSQLEGRQALVQAGHHFALGNTYLIKGIHDARAEELTPTARLQTLRHHLKSARPQYKEALAQVASVDPKIIPEEQRMAFEEVRVLFAAFVDDMQDMIDLIDALTLLLGDEEFKRYIVVFQNSWEIRPTGGFWGSFAICDVQKGKFLGCEVPGGGLYDLKGQYGKYYVPPLPMQFLASRWECHDQNWWPHFPASAQKLVDCYEEARGASVDGVIALNSSVLERILEVVGPVNNEKYNLLLDTDTALARIQEHVEHDDARKQNTPKAIIGDLLEQFLTLLTDMDTMDMMQLLTTIHDAATEKEIQVFVHDQNIQKLLRTYGWSGEILPVEKDQDYLMVVNTNIAGEKSDAKVEQHIDHQAVIQDDGSIIVTALLHRKHVGGDEDERLYNAPNVNYVRFYVPEGSVLLEAKGFEYPPEEAFRVPETWYETDPSIKRHETGEIIDRHTGTSISRSFGKTVFGNCVMTRPGEETHVYVVYKLPFTLQNIMAQKTEALALWHEKLLDAQMKQATRYTLIAQPQSGVKSTFHSQIMYPKGWQPAWRSHDIMEMAENGGKIDMDLNTDVVVGLVMEKESSK